MSPSGGPQQLVYDVGVESLFRGIGEKLTPELRLRVRKLGIDLDQKLLPGYPKDVWVRVVDEVAREFSANSDLAAARKELGHAISRGFADSTMGKLMAPGVRLMGVRRMLLRLPKSLTMSNNFMRVAVTQTGSNLVRVEMNEPVPSSEFLAGVIEAIITYSGGKSSTITWAAEGPLTVFSVAWAD
ncbi:MAG: DUF2378 family protein [Archangium sp.]